MTPEDQFKQVLVSYDDLNTTLFKAKIALLEMQLSTYQLFGPPQQIFKGIIFANELIDLVTKAGLESLLVQAHDNIVQKLEENEKAHQFKQTEDYLEKQFEGEAWAQQDFLKE